MKLFVELGMYFIPLLFLFTGIVLTYLGLVTYADEKPKRKAKHRRA